MEKFGEILSNMPIDPSLKVKKSKLEKSQNELSNECIICEGRGWISLDKPIGDPNFGHINPCMCREENIDSEKKSQLLRYSNLGHLSRFTFKTLNTQGLSKDRSEQETYEKSFEIIKNYSENPNGWLIISGDHGSGKTHIAAALTSECIKNNTPAFFSYSIFLPASTIILDKSYVLLVT